MSGSGGWVSGSVGGPPASLRRFDPNMVGGLDRQPVMVTERMTDRAGRRVVEIHRADWQHDRLPPYRLTD